MTKESIVNSNLSISGVGEMLVLPEHGLSIPVYDFRNLTHQGAVARHVANRAHMIMFGGVWGGFEGVRIGTEEGDYLHWAKQDRPKEAKYAVMASPSTSHGLIDWPKVHSDFRFLEDQENFKKLWGNHGSYLHVIAPIKEGSMPNAFVTNPKEYAVGHPNHPQLLASTASFFWRDEPFLTNLSSQVDKLTEGQMLIGVTSLNKHNEAPSYTYKDLVKQLKNSSTDPKNVHLIVRDSIYEGSEALGSHTQVRIPLIGEDPIVKVIRVGTLSPEGFEKATGIGVRLMEDAKDVRKNKGISIDQHNIDMHKRIHELWKSLSLA